MAYKPKHTAVENINLILQINNIEILKKTESEESVCGGGGGGGRGRVTLLVSHTHH